MKFRQDHLFQLPNFYHREIMSIGELFELHVHAPDLIYGLILLHYRLLQLAILRHDFLLLARQWKQINFSTRRGVSILPKSHDSYRLPVADTQLHFVRPHCSPCESERWIQMAWLRKAVKWILSPTRPTFPAEYLRKAAGSFCSALSALESARTFHSRLSWTTPLGGVMN